MSALKSGAYPTELNGKTYGLLFSLNALDAMQEKFGRFDKLDEVFNTNNPNIFKDTRWLLTQLINEGLLAEDENAEQLTEERVGRIINAGNLKRVQEAIFASFMAGTAGDTEPAEEDSEEDNEGDEGERKPVQEN